MDKNAVIKKAVKIAVSRLDRESVQPGRTLAHPSHRFVFTCESIADGMVYGDDTHGKVSFPLAEIFDPDECNDIALDIQKEMFIRASQAAMRN